MQRFENKVVLVTGARSGIGAVTARRFSREGASVVLLGHHKPDEVARELPAERTLALEVDVADAAAMGQAIAQTIERFGQLDVLVNNAAAFEGGDLTEVDDEAWRKVMAVNVDGVFHGCRAAIPHLLKSKGSIINTSSVSGLGGDWGASPYCASKGAVNTFTQALALDLGRKGVRVNAVCPTLTRTGMTEGMTGNKELVAKFEERIALGRICEPEEVAAVIAFLASEDASFITGALIPVDGGVTAANGQPKF